MNSYTPEDLLHYLYGEISSADQAAMEKALSNDWTLREKLTVLKASQERLNNIIEQPRTEAVLNILKYATAMQKVAS